MPGYDFVGKNLLHAQTEVRTPVPAGTEYLSPVLQHSVSGMTARAPETAWRAQG